MSETAVLPVFTLKHCRNSLYLQCISNHSHLAKKTTEARDQMVRKKGELLLFREKTTGKKIQQRNPGRRTCRKNKDRGKISREEKAERGRVKEEKMGFEMMCKNIFQDHLSDLDANTIWPHKDTALFSFTCTVFVTKNPLNLMFDFF